MIFGVIYKEDDILYFCFITLSAHETQTPKHNVLKSSGAFKMNQNLVLEQQSVLTDSDYLSRIQMTKYCSIQVFSSDSLQFHKEMRILYEGGLLVNTAHLASAHRK